MPGPGAFYGKLLGDAVHAGDVPEAELDEHVTHLLQVFDRIGALDDDPAWASTSIDRPEHRALAREAATAAMVLLRRTTAILPFDRSSDAHARGDRPERRTPADDGRRLGEPRAALPRSACSTRCATSSVTTSTCAYERGGDIDRTTAPVYAPLRHRLLRRTPTRAGSPSRRAATATASSSWSIRSRPAWTGQLLVPRHRDATSPTRPAPHTLALVQMGGRGRSARRRGRARRDRRPARSRHRVLRDRQRRGARRRSSSKPGRRSRSIGEFAVGPDAFFLRGMKVGLRRPSSARAPRPGGRGRGRRRRGDRRGRHQRRLGDGGPRPHVDGPPRSPGRARRAASSPPTRTPPWW